MATLAGGQQFSSSLKLLGLDPEALFACALPMAMHTLCTIEGTLVLEKVCEGGEMCPQTLRDL